MRLYELKPSTLKDIVQTVDDFSDEPNMNRTKYNRLKNLLTDKGYTIIGEGWFSFVFEAPDSSFVIKVSREPDSCYIQFTNYAMENPNKHLPKLKLIDYGDGMFVTIIEKLRPLAGNVKYDIEKTWHDWATAQNKTRSRNDVQALYPNGETSSVFDFLDDDFRNTLKKYQSLFTAINAFRKTVTDCRFDMHRDNFMQRSDGTIVITDPVTPK